MKVKNASLENYIPFEPYLPGDKAAEVWGRLHETLNSSVTVKPLNDDELKLYDALTKRLAADASLLGFTTTEIESQ